MSRIRVPVILVELYGIPAPKALGLRVLEAKEPKEYTEPSRSIGQSVYDTRFLLKQLDQEGYILVDMHQKNKPKLRIIGEEAEAKTVPVVYLTYRHIGLADRLMPIVQAEGMIFAQAANLAEPVATAQWLRKVFGQGQKATELWLNRTAENSPLLSLNMTQATEQRRLSVDKFNLFRLVWIEDDAAVI